MKKNRLHDSDRTALTVDLAFILLMCQYAIFPRVAMWLKALTLVVLMAAAFIELEGDLSFTWNSLVLAIYILINIICTVIGVVRGYAAVAIRSSTIHIIWPVTYLIFSGYRFSEERMRKLYRLFIGIICFIFVINTIVIIACHHHWSFTLSLLERFRLSGYASMGGVPYFRSEHIFFYAFFVPFLVSSVLRDRDDIKKTGVDPILIIILTVYALFLTVISGMGAIWLAVSIGVAVIVCRFLFTSGKKTVLFLVFAAVVVLAFSAVSFLKKGFVFDIVQAVIARLGRNELSEDDVVRYNQINAMLEAWRSHPLFGNGFGCPVSYEKFGVLVEQSDNEMSYFAMLYQSGIAGTAMFFIIAFQSVRALLRRRESKWICEPFAIGTVCFLIANSFNPYLSNMSTMWILYLPFLLGNREGFQQNAIVINPVKILFRQQGEKEKAETVTDP